MQHYHCNVTAGCANRAYSSASDQSKKDIPMRIVMIGAGYVGLVSGACLS
jgi:hypothetical protein